MIEILHFGLSTNRGGIETYLHKLWMNIDHERFQFSFLDTTGAGNTPCFSETFAATGCKIYKITSRRESAYQNRKELEELFRTHHFDILHFHANTLSYITPILIALKHNCKVIVHSRSAGASFRPLTIIAHYINRERLRKKQVTRIGVSKLATEWLFGQTIQSFVYNNGVDINKFEFCPTARETIRGQLGCTENYVIGNVAAFLPVKNHKFIIDVFERYLAYNNAAVLWLAGDGPLRKYYEQYATDKGLKEKVFFLGNREDISNIYAGMDLFLFPSKFEGFPNAMLEAQCAGLPCVMSDCITQEVLLADNAFVCSLEATSDLWAKKIAELAIRQSGDRSNGATLVDHRGFSVQEEIRRIEKLYLDITQDR